MTTEKDKIELENSDIDPRDEKIAELEKELAELKLRFTKSTELEAEDHDLLMKHEVKIREIYSTLFGKRTWLGKLFFKTQEEKSSKN